MPHLPIYIHTWCENYSFVWLELTNIFSCLSRCWKLELKILWLSTKDLHAEGEDNSTKKKIWVQSANIFYFPYSTVSKSGFFNSFSHLKNCLFCPDSRFPYRETPTYQFLSYIQILRNQDANYNPGINLQLLFSHLRIKPKSWKRIGVNFDERFT